MNLKKQNQDLWELLSVHLDCKPYIIEALIELRGLDYVKKVFVEDYKDYTENVIEYSIVEDEDKTED